MLFFPRSNLMQCLNHILTLYFWGSVLQWSAIKTKYPNFTFFQYFRILTMVNHVIKMTKNLFQCWTMVSRILKDMLEPYPDIAAFKRVAYNGLPLYSFFKNEWFTMRKLVITMTMTMVNHVFVALSLYSWPWVWNKKTWPWNNHAQPWKHGFH